VDIHGNKLPHGAAMVLRVGSLQANAKAIKNYLAAQSVERF